MNITTFDHAKRIAPNMNNQNCNPEQFNHIQQQIHGNTLSGMAQTASIGNHEMMTYIKLPNPASLNVTETCGNGVNGQNASDDAEFLDGLFDRMSGTSDNGSDRGEDTNESNVETASRFTSNNNSRPRGDAVFPSSTDILNGSGEDMHSKSVSSDAAATTGAVGVQFPQHMLYGTNPKSTPLPQNLLQFQSAPPGQSNSQNNMMKIETGGTSNLTTMPPWMMSAAQPSLLPVTQQQTNPMNIPVRTGESEQKSISLQTSANTNHCAITSQSTAIQGDTQNNKKPKGKLSRKRSIPFSPCASIDNLTIVTNSSSVNSKKSTPAAPPVSEDESDAQKRRRDRNQREQERSQRIASQIADLKDLLSQSNVPFKPDKFSTLVSVHEYIESLQEKIEKLDEEHKGLLDTIASADAIVNQSVLGGKREEEVMADQVGSSSSLSMGSNFYGGEGDNRNGATNTANNGDADIEDYVKGLDYKCLILRCTVALCVASIDGRLLVCNEEFIKICGLKKEALEASGLLGNDRNLNEPSIKIEDVTDGDIAGNVSTVLPCENKATTFPVLSLFNLLSREDMGTVFEAMSSMLRSHNPENTAQASASSPLLNQWTGIVHSFSAMKRKIRLNITLVRQKCGTPKYFICAVLPC